MDWFLFYVGLHRERVNSYVCMNLLFIQTILQNFIYMADLKEKKGKSHQKGDKLK